MYSRSLAGVCTRVKARGSGLRDITWQAGVTDTGGAEAVVAVEDALLLYLLGL